MDDLKKRLKKLMTEIEYTHLKKNWTERLIAGGVEQADSYKWVAELGHVVDEYERSLRFLIGVLATSDPASASSKLEGWLAYTRDMTVWKLEDVIREMEGRYEKYLPPEPEDDEEDET